MATSAAASVRDAHRYRPPALTGLAGLVERQARERPEARALVVGRDRLPLSYRDLAALAGRTADRLRAAGLRRGDVVALVSSNTVEFVVALLGAARAGLVTAPLDPALPASELAARTAELGARAVLAAEDGVGWTVRVALRRGGAASVGLRSGALVPGPPPGLAPQDTVVLCTAGTMGRARLVPLSHANVAASVRGICATYELGPRDATVAVMPFFHGHGLFAALLAPLATGGCVLLPASGRFRAETLWDDLRAVGATWFTAVPSLHEALLARSETQDPGPHPPPLRFVRSCGGPLNAATQRALERMFAAPLLSAYGTTESTHQIAGEPLPQRGPLKQGTVGRATGVRLRVVGPDGRDRPAGVRGEVWVQGPTVARGRLAEPGGGARVFTADGWLRTGDLGSLDEDGYLSLAGRIGTLIERGGRTVSPEYVEDVLAGCPSVVEAAVFGVADGGGGQRVAAAVVVRGEECAGPAEILRYCRDRLAAFAVPERIVLVGALPRTAQGGLDRIAVRDRYA
ncbi:FadD7 family fatty acid--CoA ligase [Streptomyces longispororuber]|uniref:FadD7 family fatty acid--CoA ligase n=1 Tax=Streptomyces longispororuber TaxID=68230 RepID=UPI002108F5FA|nr:FadD7 family fatty acid--CoA ligase [Streptomyces longispororuber]MCQ4207503.1 FadD7 family fatty acid--CoA ligase [Streptomyces longispororuber]